MDQREIARQAQQAQSFNIKLTLAFIAGAAAGVWVAITYITPSLEPVPAFLATAVAVIVGGVVAQRLLLNVMAR
jgi:hypothetical protein